MSVYELLRTKWIEAGIRVNEGVSQAALSQFEERYDLTLPTDFKTYLLTVNGMQEGEVDEDLISFLSLEAIGREPNIEEISEDEIQMVVAEYCVYSHLYVLRYSRKGKGSPIFMTDGEHEKELATSFEDFASRYLSNPRRVAHCWSD